MNNNNDCGCGQEAPCSTHDCSCKVLVTTDCVTLKEDLVCSNILKGQTETEVWKQFDAYICERFTSVEQFFSLINVGAGAKIYKGISVIGKKEIKSLIAGNLITVTEGTNEITIAVNESALDALIEQNNFVRQIVISSNNLPVNYTEQDIVDYILSLPTSERTINDTDSKWNIVIFEASS